MSTNNASPAIRGIQGLLLKPTAVHNFVEPKGVVYTKPWVVDLLLDVAGYKPENNLVDKTAVEPAAGNGAFLASMISRLVSSCRSQGRSLDDCRQSIMAYELDNRSAMAARQTAIGALTKENVEPEKALQLAEGWINVGDYLLEGALLEADFVIGNPPYVRLEDIPEDTANAYRNSYPTMCGRADLYVAFFEAALHQLKHDGVCAFICADRWMKNQYGSQLRQLISSSYSVDFIIEMHEANAFEDEVDAYPAITVIRRKRQQITVVAKALSSAEEVESRIISELLTETKQGRPVVLPSGLSAAAVDHWFEGSEPWPCSSPQQLKLLRELEGRFGPLESDRRRTKVGIGVATGNDEVFITRDPSIVEQSRLLKLALAKDISSGVMTWSGHCLINPWEKEGLVSLENFPRLQSYFEKHSESVRKRNISRRNPVD